MFLITTKFTRKKAVIGVLLLAVFLIALILLAGRNRDVPTAAVSSAVSGNAERIRFLQELGWEVNAEPLEVQEVHIPRSFTGIYAQYADLQEQQGYSLTPYGGMTATRYSYSVLNHPSGAENVVADLLVYRDRVIAGDIQSTALDGFMTGLAFPDAK